jgi:hypothetical protein
MGSKRHHRINNKKHKKRKLSEKEDNNNNNNDNKQHHNNHYHESIQQQLLHKKDHNKNHNNPLYQQQAKFLSSLSSTERTHYFSDAHVSPERRAQLWMDQATIGEACINRYAWATPHDTALRICQEFSPIIELGCGRNAYWAQWMIQKFQVDVIAFDGNVQTGGLIPQHQEKTPATTTTTTTTTTTVRETASKAPFQTTSHYNNCINNNNNNNMKKNHTNETSSVVVVQQGGPAILKRPEYQDRTLFLCYPDEEDEHDDNDDDNVDDNNVVDTNAGLGTKYDHQQKPSSLSFGWQCLNNYQGKYLIHVGELAFLDANLCIDQAPWGRSSSLEFQQRLASEFHCLLKVQLPNWLHVRDSISVWKRSEICPIFFSAKEQDDDDDDDPKDQDEEEEDEEVIEYRHIPPEELLPQNIAAPCLAHLLPTSLSTTMTTVASIDPLVSKSTTDDDDDDHDDGKQQFLVHFQSKTHVVSVPSTVKHPQSIDDSESSQAILQYLAKSTGWPVSRLKITHWNFPFVHVTTHSTIRGGKGGFGTLLKGQSRQAGAKLTTDFGACRDLQGRRLRHVNDEIKLRKFRDRQRREKTGETIDPDELWKTPSGIYNWHLMTPTWADISKKATFRIKRQFRQMEREDQKRAALKKEQEEIHQKTMVHYLTTTTALSESIQQDLGDAIKQGLINAAAASKTAKKRKLPNITAKTTPDDVETGFSQDDQPSSLVSLTGDVVIIDDSSRGSSSVQLQSKSEFMTAVLVLDGTTSATPATNLSCYYEITLVTGGLAQIGWACLSNDTATFKPNNDTGDGVGDDGNSFAVDGSRGLKFHNGQEWPFSVNWKAGDCLGCLLENSSNEESTISFSLNGKDVGVAFTTKLKDLVPAFSCNEGEILEVHTSRADLKHFPANKPNLVAVKDLLQENECVKENSNDGAGKKRKATEVSEKVIELPQRRIQEASSSPTSSTPLLFSTKPIQAEPLDLNQYNSVKELESLGLDRLKNALLAINVKCG